MPRAVVLLLALPPLVLFAQGPPAREVERLIKNLGSSNYKVRQEALTSLKERPEAAPALRMALKSPDTEVARRAADVLEYFDRKPVRDLEAAINNGQVERFAELMLDWPDGRYEAEAWTLVCDFANKLRNGHEKNGGAKIRLSTERRLVYPPGEGTPLRIREKSVTTLTSGLKDLEKKSRPLYLCVDQVDLYPRQFDNPPKSDRWDYDTNVLAIIARRSSFVVVNNDQVVFSAGPMQLGAGSATALVVSAGDVILDAEGLENSLIIAKGYIIIKRNRIERTRLIAGKRVVTIDGTPDLDESVIISEYNSNPLGFIRWAEPAKGKDLPRTK